MSGSSGNTVYNIVLFSFQGAKTAQDLASDVKASGVMEGTSVLARAIVERDAGGKLHIHEPGHGGVGGAIGAVAGGLAGLLLGPVGVLALAVTGAVLGGVAGHFAGREIPTDDLKQLGESLPPDSSALVAIVEDKEAEKLIDDMKDYKANIVTLTVGDELSGVIGTMVAGDIQSTAPAAASGSTAAPAASNTDTTSQS